MSYLTAEIEKAAIEEAAQKLLPKALRWMKQSEPDYPHNEAEILDDLRKALDNYELDGYHLAKELDDWCPDSELVEILDHAGYLISSAERRLVQARLEAEGIKPLLVKGAVVQIPGKLFGNSSYLGKNLDYKAHYEGTVTDIDSSGKYTINCPAAGHIQPGADRTGVTGVCLYWHDVEAANTDLLLQPTQNSDIV